MTYTTWIPCTPTPKARPRITRKGHAYTPAKTADAEALVRAHVSQSYALGPQLGPLTVKLVFRLPKPKSKGKKACMPTSRPDADNLAKLVLDALNGVMWYDDSQICNLGISKIYTDAEHPEPGVWMSVVEAQVA